MEKVVIGDCTLYHASALDPDLWKELSNSADCILSDPPYKLTSGGKNGELSGILSNDRYDNSGEIVLCDITWHNVMQVFDELSKENSDIYIMANSKNQFEAQLEANKLFKFHNIITWDKGSVVPNRWYMNGAEFVLYYWKGKARAINNKGTSNVLDDVNLVKIKNPRNKEHPNEKPVDLLDIFVNNSTNVGDLVIDPFMGSGSCGISCVRNDRKFVGVELDKDYFDMACENIREFYEMKDNSLEKYF